MPSRFNTSPLLATIASKRNGLEPNQGAEPREARRMVELPAVALLGDGSAVNVRVLDLSYNGCRIESALALLPGVQFTLSVLGLGKMPANVRWYSDGFAGLSFRSEPIELITETPRQDERISLQAQIHLRRSGRKKYSVMTMDVSCSGCRVEFIDHPSVGERHYVKFDGLNALEAEVRWVEGLTAGLEFVRKIYPPVFELVLIKLGHRSVQSN